MKIHKNKKIVLCFLIYDKINHEKYGMIIK